MRSPIAALTWEILRRNRRTIWAIAAIVLLAWFFNFCFAKEFRPTDAGTNQLLTINCLLTAASLLLLFGVFNYTEFNPQKEWTGFPYRLFALPVTALGLMAVPMLLGIAGVELVFLVWVRLIFTENQLLKPEWFASLLGAYMIFYQTILWTLAGFRILRIIVLSLIGTSFVGVAFLPFFEQYVSSPWLSEKVLIPLVCGLAFAAFSVAWVCVLRQRYGGGHRRNWVKCLIEQIADALPRRKKGFRSAASAQLWYEWRRAGLLLPSCIGALLILVIAPLSWLLRNEAGSAAWILAWTLAMPMILAFPLGKGFSKADFWSKDLALPAFVAIRPLATGEMIVTKMKVAALSAGISWLLVLLFLSIWLPLWADLAPLMMIRIGFWMTYGHSMWAEYAMSALFVTTSAFVTWKLLVGGLWVGLSGSRKKFITLAAVYCLVPLLGFIGLAILLNHDQKVRAWATKDPNRVVRICEWIAVLAVIAKFWLAAFSWRSITPARVRAYLLLWSCATLLVITLAILLWANGLLTLQLMALMDSLPLDVYRLRNLLLLLALLVIPFARLGYAPSALARNRHR
jgi:hypothetical protein